MRAGRGSARALKKLFEKMVGGSKETSSAAAISQLNPASIVPPTESSKRETRELINTNNNDSKSGEEDANNNEISARATTTANNLTATVSECGPLMKVVVSPQRGPVELLQSEKGATLIYTDASIVKDGTTGIGIYFGKDHPLGKEHPLNTSERLPGKHKSIGWAEIIAATTALMKLRDWPDYNKSPVILRTDCLTLVEAMQCPVINERTHHKFFVELQTLKKVAEQFPYGVQFEHVYAHNGDEGNEEADALATKATSKYNQPSPRRTRSKPPSETMKRRTRSAYVKRSAPPRIASSRSAVRRPVAKKSVHDVPTISYIPPPDVIARRDKKQQEIGAADISKAADTLQYEELSIDTTQSEGVDKTQSDSSMSTNEDRSLRSTLSHVRFGARPRVTTPHSRQRRSIKHDGRPPTYAPKKKHPFRERIFDTPSPAEKENRRSSRTKKAENVKQKRNRRTHKRSGSKHRRRR